MFLRRVIQRATTSHHRHFSSSVRRHGHAVMVSEAEGSRRTSSFKCDVTVAGGHMNPISFSVDEVAEHGGTDSAPAPFDYLLAAVASCATHAIRRHANKENWKLESVVVKIDHDRTKARKGSGGKVDQYKLDIELFGDLTHEQRMELLKAAETQSAVSESLRSSNEIEYHLHEDPVHHSGKKKHDHHHHKH